MCKVTSIDFDYWFCLPRNLLFVKNFSGDVTELGLDFSVVNEVLGVTSHVELKPNGKNIVVNNNNRIEYVHLMADYKLNKQVGLSLLRIVLVMCPYWEPKTE